MSLSWTRTDLGLFERPLGLIEQGFYWDSIFNGTADFLEIVHLETASVKHPDALDDSIRKTWLTLKQRFPLLGSSIEERGDSDDEKAPYFLVDPTRLSVSSPEEVTFKTCSTLSNAMSQINSFFDNGQSRLVSNSQLARLFIFRSTHPDENNHLYAAFLVAHCITDGIGNVSLARYFLETLSDPKEESWPLHERMNLARSTDDLIINSKGKSLAMKRWQKAIGAVLWDLHWAKLQGGQTLPRNFTTQTSFTLAKSSQVLRTLTAAQSEKAIQSCRRLKATFGAALPILGQVAMARLLCRLYLEGRISEEEWEYRKQSNVMTLGPMNIRPYLDEEWLKAGGSSNVSLAIGFFFHHLFPFPFPRSLERGNSSVPLYLDLLSPSRFLYRAKEVQKQSVKSAKHPRMLDIGFARAPPRVTRARLTALAYRRGDPIPSEAKKLEDWELAKAGPVFTFGGSSMGNKDLLIESRYPLPSTTEEPGSSKLPTIELRVHSSLTHLHTRPSELYLGSFTTGSKLHFIAHIDANTYDEDLVGQWLDEIVEATKVYLIDED